MTRPSVARIDLAALRHNARHLQALHGGRQLAVLKADAYGHGAIDCARALRGLSDGLAVAFVDEARALRAAGLTAPILVLEGAFDADEVAFAAAASLWLVVHQDRQLHLIEQASLPDGALQVWLKIDSGMHRAGFAPERARELHQRLQADPRVGAVTLMSHFARADEPGCDLTARQTALFEQATAGLPGPRSLCNSAGVLAWPSAHRDWARPGIALYGADPLLRQEDCGLRPVMTLASQVFAERWLAPGEPLGYGTGFTATAPTRVGLVALGYADGYPRTAPTGTPVAVEGRRSRLIGRVSMDMLTVDLTGLPDAGIGSPVELWGAQIPVNAVAGLSGTLAYELLCNVKRVPRQRLRGG
ncbi:MAG: alanine racemase [Pseudomonadota bacterium]